MVPQICADVVSYNGSKVDLHCNNAMYPPSDNWCQCTGGFLCIALQCFSI